MRCREPRRAGSWPDGTAGIGTGATGSLDTGVWTRLQVQVSPAGDVVDDARFRVFGCSAAVASASFVADAIVGVRPDAVGDIEPRTVAEALALPEEKHAMAAMAIEAARAAIADWETRTAARSSGPGAPEGSRSMDPETGERGMR
jgi:NifU-like protein involved in Fe-S cluster formation